MFVVLFRHAHKGVTPPQDPTLSPKGYEQAARLKDLIFNGVLPIPTHCWVSEMMRTKETLDHAIQHYRPKVHLREELNVRTMLEELSQFRGRIQKFVNEITARASTKEAHYICTHYDWIEESMSIIDCNKDLNSSEFASWAPGQYIVFDVRDGIWTYSSRGST